MSAITGYPTIDKKIDGQSAVDSIQNQYATIQPTGSRRHSIDVVPRIAFLVGTDTCESGSTTSVIAATSHSARQGDFLRFTTANANQYIEMPVIKVTTNAIYLGGILTTSPSVGNSFSIMRYVTQTVDSDGAFSVNVTATSGSTYLESVRNDYSSTNVTTGAWVELVTALSGAVEAITIFDSGGYTMELGIGAAAAETRTLLIPPGGIDGMLRIAIPSGSRISIRAVGAATVSVGEICINFFA